MQEGMLGVVIVEGAEAEAEAEGMVEEVVVVVTE